MQLQQQLLNTLDAGQVLRYHATPSVPCQELGSHQWAVAMIAFYLCKQSGYSSAVTNEVIAFSLVHDNVELYTGDIPATTKWAFPCFEEKLKEVEKHAAQNVFTYSDTSPQGIMPYPVCKQIVKIADHLEGYRWCKLYENGSLVTKRWEQAVVKKWLMHKLTETCLFSPQFMETWKNLLISFGVDSKLLQEEYSVTLKEYKDEGAEPTKAYVQQ